MSTFVSFAGRGTQVSVQSRATVSSSPPPLPSPSSAFPLHMCWTHIFKILDYRRAKSQVCPGCLSAQHRSPESGLSHSKAVLFPLHLFTSVMSRNSISWRLELWEIRKKKKKKRPCHPSVEHHSLLFHFHHPCFFSPSHPKTKTETLWNPICVQYWWIFF